MKRVTGPFLTILGLSTASVLAADSAPLTGAKAFGDWQSDKPGVRRLITLKDMPAPDTSQSAQNRPTTVKMPAGAKPLLPEGFAAEMIASGVKSPRIVRVAPNGDLFVADSKANEVRVYRLRKGSAEIEKEDVFSADLHQPYGIAFHPPGANPSHVYIGNSHSVVRFAYKNGDMKAAGKPETIVDHIPAAHHWTRDIVFSPDGGTLYLAVGSGSNIALDMSPEPRSDGGLEAWKKEKPLGAAWDTEEKRADVLAYSPDGRNERIFATGLRNCSGMAVEPRTAALWCVVNERDGIGDDTPLEYATAVKEGAFYGWPWYLINGEEEPRRKGQRPDLAGKVTAPDVLIQAHSAPLGIAFYDKDAFPEAFRGNAFVALHGSWNRAKRTGYKVVMLPFRDGKPTGEYVDFMTGFVTSDKEVWGRPVGVAVANDGALIVTEDGSGTIWRVTYKVAR